MSSDSDSDFEGTPLNGFPQQSKTRSNYKHNRRELIEQDGRWGFNTNGDFEAATNFNMRIVFNVDAGNQSGYAVKITRYADGKEGEGFFTHNNTKSPHDFKMALNNSFGHGGRLNLSMTQKDLFRFIESVESLSRASDKQLVTSAGLQNDKHTMAINNKLFIDREGNEINDSPYIWISRWPEAPSEKFYHYLERPYSMEPLKELMQKAHQVMSNNYAPFLLTVASGVLCHFYKEILEMTRHYNLPVVFGPPMTGKSTAAFCAARICGCTEQQFYSRCTLAFLQQQLICSGLLMVVDDIPTTKDLETLAMDLSQGAIRGKANDEARPPLAGCLVTANFDLSQGDTLKYYSRLFLIVFEEVNRRKNPGEGVELEEMAKLASSSFPKLVCLMKEKLTKAVINKQTLEILEHFPEADIRLLEGMAIPLAFSRIILEDLNLDHEDQLLSYLETILIPHHRHVMTGLKEITNTTQPSDQNKELLQQITATVKQFCFESNEARDNIHIVGTTLYIRTSASKEIADMVKSCGCKKRGKSRFNGSSPKNCYQVSLTIEQAEMIKNALKSEDIAVTTAHSTLTAVPVRHADANNECITTIMLNDGQTEKVDDCKTDEKENNVKTNEKANNGNTNEKANIGKTNEKKRKRRSNTDQNSKKHRTLAAVIK